MTPEDRELTNWLCRQIQKEHDPKRFGEWSGNWTLCWQMTTPCTTVANQIRTDDATWDSPLRRSR